MDLSWQIQSMAKNNLQKIPEKGKKLIIILETTKVDSVPIIWTISWRVDVGVDQIMGTESEKVAGISAKLFIFLKKKTIGCDAFLPIIL
jgi:hypothetical protein